MPYMEMILPETDGQLLNIHSKIIIKQGLGNPKEKSQKFGFFAGVKPHTFLLLTAFTPYFL